MLYLLRCRTTTYKYNVYDQALWHHSIVWNLLETNIPHNLMRLSNLITNKHHTLMRPRCPISGESVRYNRPAGAHSMAASTAVKFFCGSLPPLSCGLFPHIVQSIFSVDEVLFAPRDSRGVSWWAGRQEHARTGPCPSAFTYVLFISSC